MADEHRVAVGEIQRISFFNLIKAIIGNRQSSILHKIINVFTTNYDLLIEKAFEKSCIDYIDGFAGRLNPTFSTANYGVVLSRQTSISSMTSEIVTFNLYKVHGSINWTYSSSEIMYTNHIEKIRRIEEHLNDEDFSEYYSTLAIVNPSKNKLKQTVLDVNYYDQLRMFCNELEKNNTLLISYGFSFADEHILQMTLRALKGNPTFSLIIFSFNEESTSHYSKIFEDFPNVSVFQLVAYGEKDTTTVLDFTQEEVNHLLQEVYNGTK